MRKNLNLVQGPGAAVEVGKKGKGGGKKGSKVGELFFLLSQVRIGDIVLRLVR